MLRTTRRRAIFELHRCHSNLQRPSALTQPALPPWGNTTLEALCRRDQSGEALRVIASLGLGVLNESDRWRRRTGVGAPPSNWHTMDGAPMDRSANGAEGSTLPPGDSISRWTPGRVRRCAAAIQSDLIGREREATLLLLAALAGEHALIVGPAGVGKSLLAKRLAQLLCGDEPVVDNHVNSESSSPDAGRVALRSTAAYFERQLSRFSTPEELLGPLSISALKVDQHIRCSEGHLLDPAIRVGFIDEIFRGSTAILNTLLELLASPVDHSFAAAAAARDKGQARPCLIAASHPVRPGEIGSDLAPLLDRFLLLVDMQPLPAERRRELLSDHTEATARVASDRVCKDASTMIGPTELAELAEQASAVVVPEEVAGLVLGVAQAIEGALLAAAQEAGTGNVGVSASLQTNVQTRAPEGLHVDSASRITEQHLISDRRLVRSTRLLCYAAAADGRTAVDKWDCILLLHVLPPMDCASAATDAAVNYLRVALADSSTVVRRIERWLERQLHRLWRDAEFNAAAKSPRPSSFCQQQEVKANLAELQRLKATVAELGARAEREREKLTAEGRRPDANDCEEHGVLSIHKVLESHGWLSRAELELIYGARGVHITGKSVHRQQQSQAGVKSTAARDLAWENRLWRLWRDLSTMEDLMVGFSEPSGRSEPPATGTIESLREALPQQTRRIVLGLLGMDAHEHVRRWPELHRGRGYKNQAALISQNRRRGIRALAAICETDELESLWEQMTEVRPSFEHIARLEASKHPREF